MTTTSAIDLSRYCDRGDSSRYDLGKPFVQNGWRYATDIRRIAVRVPAPGEPETPIPENKRRPRMSDVFPPLLADPGDWQPWPHVDPCSICVGTGEVDCTNCGGDGICNQCKCKGEHECNECDGEGSIACERCAAKGSFDHRFGKAELALGLAYLVSLLPSVQYVPQNEAEAPVRFKFDGGEGMVASLRQG